MLSPFEAFLTTLVVVLTGIFFVLVGQITPLPAGEQMVALGISVSSVGLLGTVALGVLYWIGKKQ